MARDKEHAKQLKNASRARYRAVARLIEAHKAEYQQMYAEEAAKVGVIPLLEKKRKRIETLKQYIEQTEKLLADTDATKTLTQ